MLSVNSDNVNILVTCQNVRKMSRDRGFDISEIKVREWLQI